MSRRRNQPFGMLSLMPLILVPFIVAGCIFDDETDLAGLIGSQFASIRFTQANLAEGTLKNEVAINPDTFLSNLREKLGRSPTALEVTRIVVRAGSPTTGLESWSEAFDGELFVWFIVNGAPPIAAGTLTVPNTGLLPIEGRVSVTRATLDLFPDIAAGRFSVRLQGSSPRSVTAAFDLPTRVELEFLAF